MQSTYRDTLLTRLKASPGREVPERPKMPPLQDLALDREALIDKFTQTLAEQTAVIHRVANSKELLDRLETVVREEAITGLFLGDDPLICSLGIDDLATAIGLPIHKASEAESRNTYKTSVFTTCNAGMTSADFAVAESGTLIVRHAPLNARLISLAPLIHLAVVPADRIVPVYEAAMEAIRSSGELPSQLTFISGPSMTADIQATPFRGMHGPKRLIVFILDIPGERS